MSILEVMFAILVTTVGLLGAVAVFPVASSMARKGRINDQAAASGRSAFHNFDARGMRRPDRWIGFKANWNFPNVPNGGNIYDSIGNINWPPGTAFCIDPRMIGFYANYFPPPPAGSNSVIHAQASLFPAVQRQQINGVPGAHAYSVDPRMFRVTLAASPTSTGAMGQLQADSIFTFDDDLSYKRPDDDRSKPAEQNFDLLGGTGQNAKRLADGHFSWMATLVPKVELVQKFLPGGGGSVYMAAQPTDEYVLSIVVYHDRSLDPTQIDPYNERMVIGQIQGDGSTGGEILLQDNDPKMLKLRANDWVLLSGVYTYWNPQANQQMLTNVPAFQWYRVTHCDHEPQSTGGNPSQQVYATLTGQDWNTSIVNPRLNLPTATGTTLVTMIEGVVAVYEKTVRLEY